MPPLIQRPTAHVLLATARWQLFGLVCLVCHTILVRDVGVACFPLILVCLLAVSRYDSLAGLTVHLQILLYQNVTISIFSTEMTRADYTILSGTSFAAALLLAGCPAYRFIRHGQAFQGRHRGLTRIALAVALAVAVAAAYTVMGAAVSDPTAAAVGFRNATAMLLALVIGLDVGDRWSYRTVATCFIGSTLLGFVLVMLELSDPAWYLTLVNAADFSNVKYATSELARYYSADDVVRQATQQPFNTDLLTGLMPDQAYRFAGPNMHSISYGYVLAAIQLTLLSLGWIAPALPLLMLSFLIGVKGAAILIGGSVLLHAIWQLTRSVAGLLSAGTLLAAAYITFGIWSGLRTGDFHVIGLLGGVRGFLEFPVGHGIGVGGNLSVGSLSISKWQELQRNGADFGFESAVGVLLYQMGVGCIPLAAAMAMLVRAAPLGGRGTCDPAIILFIGLFICLVNGVFQEEAYSPYAAGLLCLLCGVIVANGRRMSAVVHG